MYTRVHELSHERLQEFFKGKKGEGVSLRNGQIKNKLRNLQMREIIIGFLKIKMHNNQV